MKGIGICFMLHVRDRRKDLHFFLLKNYHKLQLEF